MRACRIVGVFFAMLALSAVLPAPAHADVIVFKRGGKKKCVVIDEGDKWVSFLTAMGEVKMPRARIESIEHESDEVNAKLKEEWKREHEEARKPLPPPRPRPVKKKQQPPSRTYRVDIKKRRISIGGRATGIGDRVTIASFVIKDRGMVEGSRLFNIEVTSYKNTPYRISPPDFYVLSTNGMRIDPRPLKDYDELNVRLDHSRTVSGYIAFATDAKLKTLILRSDIADFELDLETGQFVSQGELF